MGGKCCLQGTQRSSVCEKLICLFVFKHECISLLFFVRSKYTAAEDGIKQCYIICQRVLHNYGWFMHQLKEQGGQIWPPQTGHHFDLLLDAVSLHPCAVTMTPTVISVSYGTSWHQRLEETLYNCTLFCDHLLSQRTSREMVRTIPASGCEAFKLIFTVSVCCLIYMMLLLTKNVILFLIFVLYSHLF